MRHHCRRSRTARDGRAQCSRARSTELTRPALRPTREEAVQTSTATLWFQGEIADLGEVVEQQIDLGRRELRRSFRLRAVGHGT